LPADKPRERRARRQRDRPASKDGTVRITLDVGGTLAVDDPSVGCGRPRLLARVFGA
jgi:hypothetical protein